MITPDQFIAKWTYNHDTERAAAQTYFLDLCELLDIARPYEVANLAGQYGFEVALRQDDNRGGFADVYKQGCFAGEFKRPGTNLQEALWQLNKYTPDLGNPPILFVSDRHTIHIHTRINGLRGQTISISLGDLREPGARALLQWALTDPYQFARNGNQQQLMQAASDAYLPRRPIPVVQVREELALVDAFTKQVQQALAGLRLGDRRVWTDAGGYRNWQRYTSFDFNSDWKSEQNKQRTLHPELQSLQDNLASMLAVMAGLLQEHLLACSAEDGQTYFALDESQPFASTAKVSAIIEQYNRIRTGIDALIDMRARVARAV